MYQVVSNLCRSLPVLLVVILLPNTWYVVPGEKKIPGTRLLTIDTIPAPHTFLNSVGRAANSKLWPIRHWGGEANPIP